MKRTAGWHALNLLTAFLMRGTNAIAEQPIDIGSRRELFVDRLLIERMQHVELRKHHPGKTARPKSPLPDTCADRFPPASG